MINALNSSVSGMIAQSTKIAASASNIANADVIGSLDANAARTPYQALDVNITSTSERGNIGGVRPEIYVREPATTIAYDPTSQYADKNGFVGAPNVNLTEEVTSNIVATQAYKANAQMISVIDDMNDALLNAVRTDA